MLVLTRRIGEAIVVCGAKITVLSAGNGRTRLGIDAPEEVRVFRAEHINDELMEMLLDEEN